VHTPFIAHTIGLRVARRLGIPIVETYHTFFEEYFTTTCPGRPRACCGHLARDLPRQCNAVDAVIAPSPQMAEVLHDYGVRTEIQVIPTGLDIARLTGGDGAGFAPGTASRLDDPSC
jgi:glycosyltransferase involved in cell wall biosynthesis